MSREKQRQLDEINRPRNEELFNNLEKQYQEVFKVKAESEQIEEMAKVYENAQLKARDTLGSMNEGEEMWYSKAFYEAGYRKQEWISVEERLPDKEGTYLTYTDKDNVDLDIFCIYPSHGTKFWSDECRGKVTHWMPLPEAPKMKGGAE